MTQKEFAKILGVSESSIAHYEQGITMPGADIILKCAEYFNVNIDYIFGRCSYKSNYINLNSIFCKKMQFSDIINIASSLTPEKQKLILSISLDTFSTQNPKSLGNQLSEMEQISMERSGMDICSISGAARSGG